jgi:hypothetical protein
LNSIKWNTGPLREVFVLDSAVFHSENGLWGQICHRHAGVWFKTEDSLQPVCEPANFVIEGKSDLSLPWDWKEGHSAWPLSELMSDSSCLSECKRHLFHFAISIWPHKDHGMMSGFFTSILCTQQANSKQINKQIKLVHMLEVCLSRWQPVSSGCSYTMQKFFMYGTLQKALH